jgi:hypothetical protein
MLSSQVFKTSSSDNNYSYFCMAPQLHVPFTHLCSTILTYAAICVFLISSLCIPLVQAAPINVYKRTFKVVHGCTYNQKNEFVILSIPDS